MSEHWSRVPGKPMFECYWSQVPGKFTDKSTGRDMSRGLTWCGSAHEWFETLIEIMYDVGHSLVRQGVPVEIVEDLRITTNPNIAAIVKCTVLYGTRYGHIFLSIDQDDTMGASIDFTDRVTGEVLGTIHVLDTETYENPCPVV